MLSNGDHQQILQCTLRVSENYNTKSDFKKSVSMLHVIRLLNSAWEQISSAVEIFVEICGSISRRYRHDNFLYHNGIPSIKEQWCYTVGNMMLWEHYCYTGDCINVEASVLYKWLHNCVRISSAEMVVCICGSITSVDTCMNAGTLVLHERLSNNDRIRATEMICINLWVLSFNTVFHTTVGTTVLLKWLIIIRG
jgi:hypothetical protein